MSKVSINLVSYYKRYRIRNLKKIFLKKLYIEETPAINLINNSKEDTPMVSICIPAYKHAFFEKALVSAITQSYNNFEIVISDDSSDRIIEDIVSKYKNCNIIYHKNQNNIGALENLKKSFELSSGKYIKFLNDDDLLHKDCIESMVNYFEFYGNKVSLITSKRDRIDIEDNIINDTLLTIGLTTKDIFINGKDLGNFVIEQFLNIIGEPTTFMFRKEDMNKFPYGIFYFNDRNSYGSVDIFLALNLLSIGNVIYIAKPLSYFRENNEQLSRHYRVAFRGMMGWFYVLKNAKKMGYYKKKSLLKQKLLFLILFLRTFLIIIKRYVNKK